MDVNDLMSDLYETANYGGLPPVRWQDADDCGCGLGDDCQWDGPPIPTQEAPHD